MPNTEKKGTWISSFEKFKSEILETANISTMYAQRIYIPLSTLIETDEEVNNSSICNYDNSIMLLLIIVVNYNY